MQARRLACVALLSAALAAGPTRAHAEPLLPVAGGPPDSLKISVLTFGPGDHPFFKFGHDALWIHDDADESDRVYNFGTFSFDSPRLIFDFLHGRMTYWLSVSGLSSTLAAYEHENRSIRVQELQLDPEVKRRLKERLEVNAQPQNRAYKYDYFLDNCATRVRDAIDWAAGGRLRELGRSPARLSLRDQALRMTVSYLPLYIAIDLVLGPAADRRIDRWAEMFIPQELSDAVDEVRIPRGGAEAPAPLALPAQLLFAAARTPPPRTPPPLRGAFFGVGLLVGALFWLLGRSAASDGLARAVRLTARIAMGAGLAVWGLVVGFVGCFLVYVWGWTDHAVAHRNQNLLVCAPWSLALLVLGIGVAAGWRGGTRAARTLAAAALAATIAALLVKVGIVEHQDNGRWIAFFAPAWAGITAGLSRLVRS